ncbi:TonB-dependent receptor [Pedobacter changchengzhani]|uniref:TonB-dependent receptor n=1 Tax=Pedobacter changchengzhani TaxID=2529274 RepID=A0A4R5MPI0_9SPHI|nr:TonB-dependent receptor [Pedobacter changchengzhani]TDG37536.1 TonB-dependent receptor [Pedobacter changchengzhani]
MIKKLLKLFLVFAFFVCSNQVVAQSLQGKVADSSGVVIPGASVQIVGQKLGTSTNANGVYSIKLPAAGSYKVRVTFTGYVNNEQAVAVGKTVTTLDFRLDETKADLGDVVVIGSRSTPRTNIESVVPVDLISTKDIKVFAQTDLTQILNFVAPSFSSNRQTVADGTDHIDPASLRGLGPDQVLVLVNGKRRHTTALVNINGTFGRGSVGTDLNSIPVAAIERIEVLRDGAAAQYGSDAIAGVINIVLKKVTPYSFSTSFGQSNSKALGREFLDGRTFQADFSKGWAFNNDKGFINFAVQYLKRDNTNRGGLDTRPLLYAANPTKGALESEAAFQARFAGIKAADDARAAANGLDRNNMQVGQSDSQNAGGFLNGQFNLGKTAELYFAGGITHKTGSAAGFYRLPTQTTQVDLSIYPNGFLPLIDTKINDYSFSLGLRGKLGTWDYDLSNTSGENTIKFNINNTVNASLPTGTSPTSFYAGELLFRQNTSNFDLNKKHTFDGGFLTSLNTAFGAEFRIDNYQIKQGEPLSYSNGGRMIGTSPTASGSQVFPGFKPANALDKSRNNVGAYADFEAEFGKRLTLEAAGRYENFSDFGSNFSYKFTGKVKLFGDVSLRGAYATGFRAPSLHQQYFNNESTQFVGTNATQVLTVNNANPIVAQFGVGALKPEISKSGSLGLAGRIAKTFTFTIDAYNIDIKDRIVFSSQYARERSGGVLVPTGVVNQILNTVDPTAQVNSVQFFTNAITTNTAGIDVVLTNKFTFSSKSNLILSVAGNVNKTVVRSIQGSPKIESDPNLKAKLFDRLERSRFESSVPKNKLNLTATLNIEKLSFVARTVRFGEVTFLNAVDPNIPANGLPVQLDQTFSPKWVSDFSVSYQASKVWSVTVGANNIFDVYPDKLYIDPRDNANNLSGTPGNTYSGSLDNTSNGRFLYPRAVSQFGFNGRYVYGKIACTF